MLNTPTPTEREAIRHADSIGARGAYRAVIIRQYCDAASRDAARTATPRMATRRAMPAMPPRTVGMLNRDALRITPEGK